MCVLFPVMSCHRRIADGYGRGAAVTKFPTKYVRIVVVAVVYNLFQQSRQNIQFQHNKFNKDRQPEGQMPIMLATYSTNRITRREWGGEWGGCIPSLAD